MLHKHPSAIPCDMVKFLAQAALGDFPGHYSNSTKLIIAHLHVCTTVYFAQ